MEIEVPSRKIKLTVALEEDGHTNKMVGYVGDLVGEEIKSLADSMLDDLIKNLGIEE